MYSGHLLVNGYLSAKFKGNSIKNDREIEDINNRKLLTVYFHPVSPCDLDVWPSYPKIYTVVLQVIIYQLAKYKKDPM